MSIEQIVGSDRVVAAVRQASSRTGVDFAFLLSEAKVESGLDPNASATTSSASGLFQFTSATWMAMLRKHGLAHGLSDGSGDHAAALALRRDPQAAALMAGALTGDNAAALGQGLGRTPAAADLYFAHLLGAAGALRFLKAREATPDAAAAPIAPAAAASNHVLFFAADGSARSLSEIYDHLAACFGGNAVPPTGTDLPVASLSAGAQAARFAYLLLAELAT